MKKTFLAIGLLSAALTSVAFADDASSSSSAPAASAPPASVPAMSGSQAPAAPSNSNAPVGGMSGTGQTAQ